GQLTAAVHERIFEEQFPNNILYITDVSGITTARWRRIFMADITPPESRPPGAAEHGDSPLITLATDAIAAPDVPNNRIQLVLHNASSYAVGEKYTVTTSTNDEKALQAQRPAERQVSHPAIELDTLPLYRVAYGGQGEERLQILDARIEL